MLRSSLVTVLEVYHLIFPHRHQRGAGGDAAIFNIETK
ncbi:MAG: hypothetical protein ACJAZX_000536 [Rickettsiales bacterium]